MAAKNIDKRETTIFIVIETNLTESEAREIEILPKAPRMDSLSKSLRSSGNTSSPLYLAIRKEASIFMMALPIFEFCGDVGDFRD